MQAASRLVRDNEDSFCRDWRFPLTIRTFSTPLLAIAAAVALGFTLLWSAPVSAHDRLVSSSPEHGDELDSQPDWLELEFSGNVQDVGAEIKVMHEGADVSAGEITVENRTVKSALPDDLSPGDYTVDWRVVSEDGHPISGTFDFAIKDDGSGGGEAQSDDAAGDEAAAAEETAGLGGSAVDDPDREAADRGELTSDDAGGVSLPMMILLGVGGLAVVALVVLLFMRKRQGLPGTEGDGTGGPAPRS